MQYDLYLNGGHLITIQSDLDLASLTRHVLLGESLVECNSFGQAGIVRRDQIVALMEVPEQPNEPY